ncbi:MAG: M56 family metallopeptidase [Cellulophaga sp.]
MIQYILECLAFQLLFLVAYDLFLKGETFFQWNRLYLIGTHLLSLIIPWVKIEALKTTLPKEYIAYPEYLWGMNSLETVVVASERSNFDINWGALVLFGGMAIAAVLFALKLLQIQKLKKSGEVRYFSNFTRVIVKQSNLAFSFFKTIFLGDEVVKKEHESIIKHELVHIEQKHSWDLLFFEFLRIIFWFNPLVYVYQKRTSELHEFIADATVAKTHKKEQYQMLLSQVFQTEEISFVNHFFKSSLIKKRIVMLQKTKSKKVWQLKYLLLVPIVIGMLVYTSSEAKEQGNIQSIAYSAEDALLAAKIREDISNVSKSTSEEVVLDEYVFLKNISIEDVLSKEEFFAQKIVFNNLLRKVVFSDKEEGSSIKRKLLDPTTVAYNRYLKRRKAFQLLDNNLKISISEAQLEIEIIHEKRNYPSDYYIYKVNDIKDFTGAELRSLNNKINEVFEQKSKYTNIILTDDTYVYHVYKKALQKIEVASTKKINTESSIPFSVVDQVPIFPGCNDAEDLKSCFNKEMQKHIRKHFRYPEEAQKKGIQGRVNVMLTIDKKGELANLRLRGPDKLLEDEASRILHRLPKMKSGKHNGKKVNVAYSIPITFKLDTKEATPSNEVVITALAPDAYEEESIDVPFSIIEKVPVFPGCENAEDKRGCFNTAIQKHIRKHFRYPEEAQKTGIQGRVNIMFTIDIDGSIVNIRKRGPSKALEKEAERIIMRLPKMKAGENRGKAVRVPFSIPITFKLQGKSTEARYIQLIKERESLLLNSNKENPIIRSLDRQIKSLRDNIASEYGTLIPFNFVDNAPIYPGCENAEDKKECFKGAINKLVRKNFYYPKVAQEKGIQGRVNTMFIIEKDGSISNLSFRGPDASLEKVAMDIMSKLPKMKPGEHNGKKVRVPFSMPITFKLQ